METRGSPRLARRFLIIVLMSVLTACQKTADRPQMQGTGEASTVEGTPELVSATMPTHVKGDREEAADTGLSAVVPPRTTFIEVAKAVAPAVVHLKTAQNIRRAWSPFRPKDGESRLQELFQQFWRRPEKPILREQNIGSGFLIHPAGYLLTNHHVIDHADAIIAVLSDGHEYPAHVVGWDGRIDLAILKMEGRGPFPVVNMGDSDRLEAGEWAMAVGSPFGLAQSFTVGVISATGRSHLGFASHENFIQTDASINYGNSGGPLLNIHGEAVGINTAIIPTGRGIGFAIPINTARRFSEPILKKELIKSAWLGIQLAVSRTEAPSGNKDIVVRSVRWGSPASRSGLHRGDRVIRLDEAEVTSAEQLQRMIVGSEIGAERTLTILRDGSNKKIVVRLAERPPRISP